MTSLTSSLNEMTPCVGRMSTDADDRDDAAAETVDGAERSVTPLHRRYFYASVWMFLEMLSTSSCAEQYTSRSVTSWAWSNSRHLACVFRSNFLKTYVIGFLELSPR